CLDSMLNKVEADHAMLKKTRAFEVRLLEFTTLPEIIDFILSELKTVFSVDDVSLSLLDSSQDISACLNSYDYNFEQNSNLILLEDKVILVNEFSTGMYAGTYEAHKHEVFFPLREEHPPASISIIPLNRKDQFLGSLNLGSYRSDCFFNNFISESIPQLVMLIALAIENSLQFETLRQIQLSKSMENVNNRDYLEHRLIEELDRGKRSVNCVSCLVVDIVFSKARKNVDAQKLEQYVLESVSALLKQQLRVNDVLSYYEGKKFAVLLMNVPDEFVVLISQRIQKTIKAHKETFSGQSITFSAIIGHTSYRFKEDDSQSHQEIALKLIDEADTHLQSIEKT
ncbi:MAG: diguanylate cyclase, partial [Methylococcales bacterium]|nr:diguanylate cyclase [Methylococcales bacterium]